MNRRQEKHRKKVAKAVARKNKKIEEANAEIKKLKAECDIIKKIIQQKVLTPLRQIS